ncbi:ATP-dependent carboxylate-amine ligase domain protein ATP-grasp [Pseudomonas caricapapayae]|uniref:ATP-dependent carboxylate-amine ligase domain protein ATP-grasp n=1 Tax=Pseudomonas caricapapayae TaxID=46678 RepID=A0A3M6EKU7_9PSED|nr:ATP-grasp domain-containing protein [Pseudomonas caricapapayae]RMV68873.1 ATP-dependent carboxylate-amine ligase domain protein ATP-grasp [Pseudomonas caricapapayae]
MKKILVIEAKPTGECEKTGYSEFKHRYELFFLISSDKYKSVYGPKVRVVKKNTATDFVEEAMSWHAQEHFDAVVTLSEWSVLVTSMISKRLKLPGIDLEAAIISRNKYLMRQAHQRGGVPHPQFHLAVDLDDALKTAREFTYPVIIKPTLGASSEHIYRIDSDAEMRKLFPTAHSELQKKSISDLEPEVEYRGPSGILVESFLDGSEHSLEAIVWDGQVYIGAIGDRLSPEGATFDNDIYTMPTRLTAQQIDEIRSLVTLAASAQGINRGVLHPEIRYHGGRPYLIEMAVRAGGGPISHMTRHAYSYCAVESSLQIALGNQPAFTELTTSGQVVVAIAIISEGGLVKSISAPEEVDSNKSIIYFKLFQYPGSIINRPPHGNDLLGQITASSATLEEAYALAEQTANKVSVSFEGQSI